MSIPWKFTGVRRECVPVKIHHQLIGLPCVDLEAIPVAPVHKVLGQLFVLSVIHICDEADYCRVFRELLQVAVCRAVYEICSVEGEEERCQDDPLRGPPCCRPIAYVRHTVPCPHILWSVVLSARNS